MTLESSETEEKLQIFCCWIFQKVSNLLQYVVSFNQKKESSMYVKLLRLRLFHISYFGFEKQWIKNTIHNVLYIIEILIKSRE